MSDALEEHDGKVRICDIIVTNLQFAVDIFDPLAEEQQELETPAEILNKISTTSKMEIVSAETKLMTNSSNGIQTKIKVREQNSGTVTRN